MNLEDVNIYFVESINSLLTNDVDSEILAGMERLMNHMEMKYGIVPKKVSSFLIVCLCCHRYLMFTMAYSVSCTISKNAKVRNFLYLNTSTSLA